MGIKKLNPGVLRQGKHKNRSLGSRNGLSKMDHSRESGGNDMYVIWPDRVIQMTSYIKELLLT